jgi:S-adenosylmethionine hydrolase
MERLCVPLPHQEKTRVVGEVVYVDHFGNLITNIPEHALLPFPRDRLFINMGQTQIRGLSFTYTAVTEGGFVAVVNSWGYVEIAVRNGSAARRTGSSVGEPVIVALLDGEKTDVAA